MEIVEQIPENTMQCVECKAYFVINMSQGEKEVNDIFNDAECTHCGAVQREAKEAQRLKALAKEKADAKKLEEQEKSEVKQKIKIPTQDN